MAATSPAACPGAAWAVVMRNAPENARPKPTPATAVPARKAAAVVVAMAKSVSDRPAIKNPEPRSIADRAGMLRNAKVAAAPVPKSRKITRPPQTELGEPVARAASDGPSDRYRPPRAHTATVQGMAPAKAARAWRGTEIVGRSEATTPGRLVQGSSIASTVTMPLANTASSTHQIKWVGAGAY